MMVKRERNLQQVQLTDESFFLQGYPAPITVDDWRRHHLQSFPAFADEGKEEIANEVIQEAIETVYSMFLGVMDLWYEHEPQVYFEKTRLCYRLLICWYIADIYPEFSRGVFSTAGLPIRQRKIGPITITLTEKIYDGKDSLASLLSNPFGVKAHLMIKNAAARLRFRGVPPRIIGRETEMGWFLQKIAEGAKGRIYLDDNRN